jgi:hypothetical protein
MKRTGTRKLPDGMTGDITVNRAGMGGMAMDEYTEKPRANLYNVVKKLREQNGKMFHRICYVSRLDEQVFRGDFEKEFTNWANGVFETQADDEIPLMEGEKLEYGGFSVILGPWMVHLLEAEGTLMDRFVR